MKNPIKSTLLILAAVAWIAGCGAKSDAAAPPKPQQSATTGSQLTGTVLESQDAAGYTYLKLDAGGEPQWAAVAQTSVQKGQRVTINTQMTMNDFESKTLGRKFDRIVFGTIDDGAAPPSPAQRMAGPANTDDVHVPKASGANAMTVAEVWSSKPANQTVVVRGKVVKFLSGIMGKNWLHIRDGSGSAAKGDHDLTVTTLETAVAGEVVTVSGVVRVDRDFGAGYRYPVILEDAKLSR